MTFDEALGKIMSRDYLTSPEYQEADKALADKLCAHPLWPQIFRRSSELYGAAPASVINMLIRFGYDLRGQVSEEITPDSISWCEALFTKPDLRPTATPWPPIKLREEDNEVQNPNN